MLSSFHERSYWLGKRVKLLFVSSSERESLCAQGLSYHDSTSDDSKVVSWTLVLKTVQGIEMKTMASLGLNHGGQGVPTNLSLSINVLVVSAFVSLSSYPRVYLVYDVP